MGLIQCIPGWNDLHAQCATEQTLDYIESPCGIAFLEGQSFTLTAGRCARFGHPRRL